MRGRQGESEERAGEPLRSGAHHGFLLALAFEIAVLVAATAFEVGAASWYTPQRGKGGSGGDRERERERE